MMRIKLYNRKLADLDSIYQLSVTLAQYFPASDQFVTGIYELLLNAVEHGNLGIGYEQKADLIRQGTWHEEVSRRLSMPEYANKEVEVRISKNNKECRLTISDQGEGFAWRHHIGRLASARQPNGRGLWIVFNSKFDRVIYNPAGNEVTCIVEYRNWTKSGYPYPSMRRTG